MFFFSNGNHPNGWQAMELLSYAFSRGFDDPLTSQTVFRVVLPTLGVRSLKIGWKSAWGSGILQIFEDEVPY